MIPFLAKVVFFFPFLTSIVLSGHASNSNTSEDSSIGIDAMDKVRLVSREEWNAQPPAGPLMKLTLPVKYVIISHTATQSCDTQPDCSGSVKRTQTYHMASNLWTDIAYNFLVGGDGLVYVGRDWDHVGAHAFNWNYKSIGISFIGTFNEIVPLEKQLQAAQKLIRLGVQLGKISEDYVLLGHRQVSATMSPGDKLYRIIKTWPHWSPTP